MKMANHRSHFKVYPSKARVNHSLTETLGFPKNQSNYEDNQSEDNISNEDQQPNITVNNHYEEDTFRKSDSNL